MIDTGELPSQWSSFWVEGQQQLTAGSNRCLALWSVLPGVCARSMALCLFAQGLVAEWKLQKHLREE